MRLHDLSITAFGPFVDTVHVDFDDLAAGGLFLLTGDTGSGKTSVLDAVCFALYGEVPGDRHTARHLRSDRAAPQTEPLVALSLSVSGRTFRFTRSPAWERPKRRGTGTTRVQAHVVVEEQRSGHWVALTNRLDEAGQLVTQLLGMTCTQFTQVAMLPQGRFQAFLRASSTERHAVLQRLFRTRRYEEVERWLVDRRVELRRRCQTHQEICAGVVNRLQEAAGSGVPDTWDLHSLDSVTEDGSLERWSAELLTRAATELELRRVGLDTAAAKVAADHRSADQARATADARARGMSAQQKLAQLEASLEEEKAVAASLDAHRRAAPVLPQAMRMETAEGQHAEAEERSASHVDAVCEVLGVAPDEVDLQKLVAASTQLAEERAVAESWLPRERQLHGERSRLAELSADTARLTTLVSRQEKRAEELLGARKPAAAALVDAAAMAERAAADRGALEVTQQGLEAAAEAAELTAELTEARARLSEATGQAQELRQAYLDLRERRIIGMAAELAGSLAVGGSCPVCGSLEHPAPARGSAAISRTDEDAARERYESAEFETQTVRELVTTLSTKLQGALLRSGGHTVAYWRRSAAAAATAAAASTAAERETTRLREVLAEIDVEERALTSDLTAARVRLAERSRELAEATERVAYLAAELDALLADHPGLTSIAALVAAHRRSAQELDDARAALEARERAAHELTQAMAAAETAATQAGFGSLAVALAAVLTGSEASTRARQLDERRIARAAATDVLTEESVRSALEADVPDLAALAARLAESGRLRDELHTAHEQALVRCLRLEALTNDLTAALAEWAPVRADHALTAGLASLVEGKSVDNQLRMRLSAYVLSERLRQVVAAANERLGSMTDRRFTLEQADERGAGEQRGGLSLRVRDEWSGKQRDPATLSGGETFIVSLALALGLADTVSHEAGGTQLDTLFIDEGFGALDATTLDGVMDTLDALRDGGRVVGLVSHVAELRNRVPSQLEVRKARRGSTVRASLVDH
jgi:exonuclease SbcC